MVLVLILLLVSIFSQVTENTGGGRKILCILATDFCLSCNLAEIPVSFSVPEVWCRVMTYQMEERV